MRNGHQVCPGVVRCCQAVSNIKSDSWGEQGRWDVKARVKTRSGGTHPIYRRKKRSVIEAPAPWKALVICKSLKGPEKKENMTDLMSEKDDARKSEKDDARKREGAEHTSDTSQELEP